MASALHNIPAPLTGVRVLDLSTEIAGPYCTKLLADAGADVLKVELPDGDPLRRWTASGTPLPAHEDGVLFRFLNTSKRGAVIDYTTDSGRDRLLVLAAAADLLIESTEPARIEALGLAPHALWEHNRALSLVSISSFGRHGPWSNRPATEFTLQAWCGSTAARGTPDQPPIAAGGRLGEWLGGAYAAVAALTAYHGARRSGQGAHVDLSLFEVMALTMAPNTAVWESLAGQPSQFNRTLEIPSIVRARDGYIGFCTITGQQWRDFLVLIERPDLVDDAVLARWDERVRRADEVTRMIEAWTMHRSVAAIIERAAALRVPVGAIGTGETVPRFDHFVARGTFVQHPGASFVQPRPPYRMSGATLRPLTAAPKVGEHACAWLVSGGSLDTRSEKTSATAHEPTVPNLVMPAKAGIQARGGVAGAGMDSRFRGNDGLFMGPSNRRPRRRGSRDERIEDLLRHPHTSPPLTPSSGPSSGPRIEGPLAGLRVIDFTAFWAGPFVTQYLAAMGADVIKIESIQRPDGMRLQSVKPPTEDKWWEWSALFQTVNLGKRGITLDLSRPAGVDLVKRLLAVSDAAVENFSPRVMDNVGLVYEDLAAANPRLIMVRMPAFGLDGPWRDRVGFAQTMEQISGMAWLTGFADGPPIIPRGACDPLAGLHALVALLVALEHRERSGRGQLIESTMVEAALNAAAEIVLEFGAYGARLVRDGNRGPVGAPQNLYRGRGSDAWLAVAVTNDAQWTALVDVMGHPAWACDRALASAAGRRAQHDTIDRGLGAWCAQRDVSTAAESLLGRGIPAAPVTSAAQLDRNPHLCARGFFQSITHPVAGRHAHPTVPLRFGGEPTRWFTRPAPTLGQHTEEVLRALLGVSDAEIAQLRADGIIGERPAGL
ncbi:MAG TPA: CoA transferase [Candidatus Margulisiibacteriota bacterium]|nr:CoA transferase [Candidatus Margulisiibacteriota bacterium]